MSGIVQIEVDFTDEEQIDCLMAWATTNLSEPSISIVQEAYRTLQAKGNVPVKPMYEAVGRAVLNEFVFSALQKQMKEQKENEQNDNASQ